MEVWGDPSCGHQNHQNHHQFDENNDNKALYIMPALTKRSLATRLARLEKKLGVDISQSDDDDIEEEDALKKEVEEKEEQTEVKNISKQK